MGKPQKAQILLASLVVCWLARDESQADCPDLPRALHSAH